MPLPKGFSLRPAVPGDADLFCRLQSTDPRLAPDPVLMRDGWAQVQPGVRRERHVILEGGIPIGTLTTWRPPPDSQGTQFVDVGVDFVEGYETPELRDSAWDLVESMAREHGAHALTSACLDHEAARRAYLAGRGYLLDRSAIVSGLAIGPQRERFLGLDAEAEAAQRAAGVELTTLDRLRGRHRELYEVMVESESDIPTTLPIVHESYERFVTALGKPWIGEHRVWVAVLDGHPVGMSWLAFHPTTGNVFTNYTGVARSARGRGLGMALKLRTIAQALDAGAELILTQNDAENAPMLRINRELGYQPMREILVHRKPA